MRLPLLILMLLCSPLVGLCQEPQNNAIDSLSIKKQFIQPVFETSNDTVKLQQADPVPGNKDENPPKIKPKRRLVAAFLCLALGPFGMHRLYMGTKPHVAAAYTLTLGGGLGLVPLIDFFHIVFDPNLYKYKDNNKFLMWMK